MEIGKPLRKEKYSLDQEKPNKDSDSDPRCRYRLCEVGAVCIVILIMLSKGERTKIDVAWARKYVYTHMILNFTYGCIDPRCSLSY